MWKCGNVLIVLGSFDSSKREKICLFVFFTANISFTDVVPSSKQRTEATRLLMSLFTILKVCFEHFLVIRTEFKQNASQPLSFYLNSWTVQASVASNSGKRILVLKVMNRCSMLLLRSRDERKDSKYGKTVKIPQKSISKSSRALVYFENLDFFYNCFDSRFHSLRHKSSLKNRKVFIGANIISRNLWQIDGKKILRVFTKCHSETAIISYQLSLRENWFFSFSDLLVFIVFHSRCLRWLQ